jgi:hypothetical protein
MLAIMQPYLLPYIGYFQLIASVENFVIYDNIKYTKKGWINRNRILQNEKDVIFSLPLKNASDFSKIYEREISSDFNRDKLLSQIFSAYRRAPYFYETSHLIEMIVRCESKNLFEYLHNSIIKICIHLNINTKIIVSSDLSIDHNLKNQDKVLALCSAVNQRVYVNPIGGIELYSKEIFHDHGIDLKFIKSHNFEYTQFGNKFIPWLSIIDVMMFNAPETINTHLTKNYELI